MQICYCTGTRHAVEGEWKGLVRMWGKNYAFFSLDVLYAPRLPDLYFWWKSCVLYSRFYGNSNWHPISCRFGVIAAYCSNFGQWFLNPPKGGLRDNVRYSSWAHWKAHSGLHISVNWTFSLGVTYKSVQTYRQIKITIQNIFPTHTSLTVVYQ